MTVKLNGKDISNLFDITCKECGSKNVLISGYSIDGYDSGAVECEDCKNGVDQIE